MKNVIMKHYIKLSSFKYKMANKMKEKQKGAFAFEYIIILVLMVGLIFTIWDILTPVVMKKVNAIATQVGKSGL